MASLADTLRAKYGNMVWSTPQSPGALYPSMNMQPQTQGLDFMPSQQPDGYAMMFDGQQQAPRGLLSMITGRPDAPAAGLPQQQGLLGMLGRMSPASQAQPDMMGRISGVSGKDAPIPHDRPVKPDTYLVRKGDTLTSIAKRYGTTVKALMAKNPQIKNANKIVAGKTRISL